MREMRLQNERERSVLVVAEDTQEAVSWCRVTLAQKWKLYTFIMGFECGKKHTNKSIKIYRTFQI